MKLLFLKIIYIGVIVNSKRLTKLIKRNYNYEFHLYNKENKEFVKITYNKENKGFNVEIDNVVIISDNLNKFNKLEIYNIWNLEN